MSATRRAVDTGYLETRMRALLNCGRARAARPLLEALRRTDAQPSAFADLEVRLLLQEGRTADAATVLDAALGHDPSDLALLLHRSELRMSGGEFALGADDAAAAVIANPRDARAKAMLGIALVRLDRFDEAMACLAEAVATEPRHPGYRLALAEGQVAAGDSGAAAATLEAAVARWPSHLPLHTASIMVAMRSRQFAHAVDLADAARRAGVADACVFGLQGHALSNLGRHDDAAAAYDEALKLAPQDVYVRHLVSAAGLLPQATRAPPDYVRAVFDRYADRFEHHLIDLGYRVPGLLRAALQTHWPETVALSAVLDLGCGTGFVGVALSDLPIRRFVGVDLSGAMLARARAKAIYTELIEADVEATLEEMAELWDVILAADVLIYFGDLARVVQLSAARLRPGGLFIASFETLDVDTWPERDAVGGEQSEQPAMAETDRLAHAQAHRHGALPWRLHRQGRFSHSAGYVRAVGEAAGLQVLACSRECLRYESGAPVEGVVVVFGRAVAAPASPSASQ